MAEQPDLERLEDEDHYYSAAIQPDLDLDAFEDNEPEYVEPVKVEEAPPTVGVVGFFERDGDENVKIKFKLGGASIRIKFNIEKSEDEAEALVAALPDALVQLWAKIESQEDK